MLVAQGAADFGGASRGWTVWGGATVMVISGLSLLIGFLTRPAALVGALIGLSSLFTSIPRPPGDLPEARMTAALTAVIAIAVLCLGPGALSLDARLFGRREIVIPSRSPDSRPKS